MSTDLSRPLVAATGQHDALDGYITFREAQFAASKMPIDAGVADLNGGIKWLSGLCEHRDWTTDDPLGVGGLLFDACRLCQLPGQHHPGDVPLLKEITQACERGIVAFRNGRNPARPAPHRLAFRELGLAIGLRALPIIAGAAKPIHGAADPLWRSGSLADEIVSAGCRTHRRPMIAACSPGYQ